MKVFIYLLTLSLFFGSCAKEEEALRSLPPEPAEQKAIVHSSQELDKIIAGFLKEKNEFKWEFVNVEVVSSALAAGDSLLVVGYKPEHVKELESNIASININDPAWKDAKDFTLSKIIEELNRNNPGNISLSDILIKEDDVLPFFVIKTTDAGVISLLRDLKTSRYAEPMGYPFQKEYDGPANRIMSKSGCGNYPDNLIPATDYITVNPAAKVSWNYSYMKIQEAWRYSTGRKIGVAIIDTGLSPEQDNLGDAFNQGESLNRKVSKYGTYKSSIWPWAKTDGPNDLCGHGTQMAGAMGAPRGTDGSSTGVAYNSNLVGIRGTGDVIIESSREQNGVIDALKLAAGMVEVNIISMSIGTPLWSSSVADAVRFAYGRQKLLFCAAGTSTSYTNWYGVVFPASMNETVAVTGIEEGRYKECDTCHKGSEVDFTMVMQRNNAEKGTPLTLAHSGDVPSRVGGSSVATAITAGIAALVWSTNPALSRDAVLEKLKKSAEFYPSRDGNFGWGTIDALKAVAGEQYAGTR